MIKHIVIWTFPAVTQHTLPAKFDTDFFYATFSVIDTLSRQKENSQ